MLSRLRLLAGGLAVGASTAYGALVAFKTRQSDDVSDTSTTGTFTLKPLPPRDQQIDRLRDGHFDMLVIGGGATGCGVALDAAARGLKVALVERDDFGSGTSSRSTKLIHGGVRYLEKAVTNLDREQYALVKEALQERETLLNVAPHMAKELPIMIPIYSWYKIPYMWAGTKVYDFIAWIQKASGTRGVSRSYYLPRYKAMEQFPQLNAEGLKGCIVYYDGQHDDAAMNLAIGLAAAEHGAVVANHVEVTGLKKVSIDEESQRVCGASLLDHNTGESFDVNATVVVNATGCFTDTIRHYESTENRTLVSPSMGVHVVLPSYFCPKHLGMLDPRTSDGRVLFFLPWLGRTIVGTTDSASEVTDSPQPTETDVDFILNEVRAKLSPDIQLRREDVLAAWGGIRPLVMHPDSTSTADIPRTHFVHISDTGLVTIAGGKWTTYRRMAEDTVDAAIDASRGLVKASRPCRTTQLKLYGGEHYSDTLPIKLSQQYGITDEVAVHLAERYGDRAPVVLEMAQASKGHKPSMLHEDFPVLTAEVAYAVTHEYATTAVDVIARRTRLAFLDVAAAQQVLPRVLDIMGKELQWSNARMLKEREQAEIFLKTMSMPLFENKDVAQGTA